MKIAVTGGSGFIGTNLVDDLAAAKIDVHNLDIVEPRKKEHHRYWHHVDICDAKGLNECIIEIQPDYVVHLAARTDLNETKGLDYYRANTKGVENIVKVCGRSSVIRRVIFASSMLVNEVGYRPKDVRDYNPATLYGQSKVIGEKIIFDMQHEITEFCLVRPTSIWGEWFAEPYRNFFDFVLASKFFHPGERACTKTYGYVGNTVYQIKRLLFVDAVKVHGKVFYLGDDPPLNISAWADEIALAANLPKPRRLPYWVFVGAGLLGDTGKLMGIQLPMTSFRLRNMTTSHIIDLSRTYEVCGRLPFARAEGIDRTLKWMAKA